MIREQDIKPIPKYILKLIKQKDNQAYEKYSGTTRFYSYFTKHKKELLKITIAVRNKGKAWYCKQVAIHGIHSDNCLAKDIEYFNICGYVVGWFNEGLTKFPKWYETKNWCEAPDKYYNPYAPAVNKEYILTFEQYKYSAIDKYNNVDAFKYLRLYEKYPQAELLVKFGLSSYATSKIILRMVAKDKKFRQWLIKNLAEIKLKSHYYISTLTLAYKQNMDLDKAQQYEALVKTFRHNTNYNKIKELFGGNIKQFFNYVTTQKTNENSYIDYLNACEYLNLNMSLDKNKIPHNFKKWHDIRVDEYHKAKMEADKKERKTFYKKFSKVANKYLPLQRKLRDEFITLIAQSPADLVNEGEKLHHCVGRMNYDQKFAREESLIFFIRNKNSIDNPFVTVEYSLKNKKVVQCYGEYDSKPNDNVLNYVNNVWLPYANRKLRQLAI